MKYAVMPVLREMKDVPVFIFVKERPSHIQKSGKDMDENFSDPRSHLVCLWGSEVNI